MFFRGDIFSGVDIFFGEDNIFVGETFFGGGTFFGGYIFGRLKKKSFFNKAFFHRKPILSASHGPPSKILSGVWP